MIQIFTTLSTYYSKVLNWQSYSMIMPIAHHTLLSSVKTRPRLSIAILSCINVYMSVLVDCFTGRRQSRLLTQQSSSLSFAVSKQHILSPSLCLTPIIIALRRLKWRGRLSCGLMLDSLACPVMLTYLCKPHVLLHTNIGTTSHVHTYLYIYTKETHAGPNKDTCMCTLRHTSSVQTYIGVQNIKEADIFCGWWG